MNQYLSPADYILLAVQILLSLTLTWKAIKARLRFLMIWAGWASARLAVFWYLAMTLSAERYGDLFIITEIVDVALLAVCAVEIGAVMIPEYRGIVWQLGPSGIAASVLSGYVLLEKQGRIVLPAYLALTDITAGMSLMVAGVCFVLADRGREFYRTGRAFCLLLAGQLLAVQLPAWLGCGDPACLMQGTFRAHLVRRAGPALWALGVGALALAISLRKKHTTL